MKNALELFKKNFLLIKNNYVFVILLLILIPFVAGINNLNNIQSIEVIKTFLTLPAILLLVPLSKYENTCEIKELICNKKISYFTILIIRIITSIVIMIIFLFIFLLIMKSNNCFIDLLPTLFYLSIYNICIGLFGLMISSVFKNVVGGYLISFGYYSIVKFDIIKSINLFPFEKDYINYHNIYPLLVIFFLMIICINIYYKVKKI